MDLIWFKDLGALARTGNFSQAAQASNLSQPAFSRRIKALEGWVGARLVDRSSHPVVLTSAGLQMLEASEQALNRIETERDQVREIEALPEKYVVTFGAQHSIGWRFYPAWLQAFEASYGPVLSRLRADDLPNCVHALDQGEVDFVIAYDSAFASGVTELASLESLTIGDDRLVLVCQAREDGSPLFAFNDAAAPPIPYLRFGDAAPINRHIEPVLDTMNIRDRLGVVYENSMAGALRIRARDGGGVAWLPQSLVAPDLDAGLLTVTGKPEWEIPLTIRLYRLREHTNALTRDIWSFLSKQQVT